jgi:hypothetical protein
MTKKEYILKILDATMEYFPLAKGLKILVSNDALGETTIDMLVDALTKTIDEVNDNKARNKLQKSKEFLERLKTIEEESHLNDEKSIAMLDDMVNNI